MMGVRGYVSFSSLRRPMKLQKRTSTRVATSTRYAWAGEETREVIVTDASPRDVRIASANEESVTHQIVHEGTPVLDLHDRFLDPEDGTAYHIVSPPENPGGLGHFTIYVTERRNVGDG